LGERQIRHRGKKREGTCSKLDVKTTDWRRNQAAKGQALPREAYPIRYITKGGKKELVKPRILRNHEEGARKTQASTEGREGSSRPKKRKKTVKVAPVPHRRKKKRTAVTGGEDLWRKAGVRIRGQK